MNGPAGQASGRPEGGGAKAAIQQVLAGFLPVSQSLERRHIRDVLRAACRQLGPHESVSADDWNRTSVDIESLSACDDLVERHRNSVDDVDSHGRDANLEDAILNLAREISVGHFERG